MAERFLDFEIRRLKNWKTRLTVWTSWAENNNFQTNLLAYEAKQLEENTI